MNKIKYSFIILLVLTILIRSYYALTDDFRLANIIYPLKEREEWNFPITSDELTEWEKALNQKFTYLGKGAQVYAFGSEDGKYVIKFFKFKHLKPSPFVSLIPPIGPLADFKEKNIKRKLRKLEGVFEGHVNAYTHDRENAGLLYLHLNTTENLPLKTQLVDKIGIEREVDLNPIVFVLQKRGETLRTVFHELLSEGKIELASTRAAQILDMYVDEYSRGVFDRDHGISHNTGFIQDQPFHLDVGKLSYDVNMQSSKFYADDLRHVATKMEVWVKENYPDAYDRFYDLLENHLRGLLSQSSLSEPLPSL